MEEIVLTPDSLSSGLETTSMMNDTVPSLRVAWIKWDSGFRGSGLILDDRIIAVNGQSVAWPHDERERSKLLPRLVGQYSEAQAWKEAGAREGQTISLRVRRRNFPGKGWSELDVQGSLLSERTYVGPNSRRLCGVGGPDQMESDGFSTSWSSWYDGMVKSWSMLQNRGPSTPSITTDFELAQHLQNSDRVAFLVQKYPGQFASAVQSDFAAVIQLLMGRSYPLPKDAMVFRELGERRRQQIAGAAQSERAAFLQKHTAELIPVFPAIDPILGKRSQVTGKLVQLPLATNAEWIAQGARTWFTFSDGSQWYFAEGESAAMRQVLLAGERYSDAVAPDYPAEWSIVGRILGDPALVVVNEQGHFGLKVEPAAATVGDAYFIDLTTGADPALFAGEEQLAALRQTPPAESATPEEVFACLVGALKIGDQALWSSLYADWSVFFADNGMPIVNPGVPPSLESVWTDATREILGRLADIRVTWVDDIHLLVTGKEFAGAPVIEETLLEVDHLREQRDQLQSFSAVGYRPYWTLQRLNGGPWRFTNTEGV